MFAYWHYYNSLLYTLLHSIINSKFFAYYIVLLTRKSEGRYISVISCITDELLNKP